MAKQPLKKKDVAVKKSFKDFKQSHGFTHNVADKPLEWILMPEAFQNALKLPGLAAGYVHIAAGHSNSGKSTLVNHAMASAQRQGLIPVLYDTENNFDFSYARAMGFEAEPVYDEIYNEETGEVERKIVSYEGDFLYFNSAALADRYGDFDYSTGKETGKKRKVPVIEDIVRSITELLNAQDEGEIEQGFLFIWDSVGSIDCFKTYKSAVGGNPMQNAAAISSSFNSIINDRIPRSRKIDSPYTNTFLIVNKVWLNSMINPVGPPSLALKGGASLFYGSHGTVILCGGKLTSGTKKLTATSKGLNYDYGLETKLSCIKNQLPAPYTVTYEGKVLCTPHGFIPVDKADDYKKTHIPEILKELNSMSGGGEKITIDDVKFVETDEECDVD